MEGVGCLMRGIIPLAFALTLLTTSAYAADFFVCQTRPDGNGWSWRLIDGRRCWYPSRRRVDKSVLHWTRIRPTPVQQQEPVIVEPRWTLLPVLDSTEERQVADLMRAMEPVSAPEPELERDDSILAEICCWPPLEKETNWIGVVVLIACLSLAAAGLAATFTLNKRGVTL
jgi:hypothetical protein